MAERRTLMYVASMPSQTFQTHTHALVDAVNDDKWLALVEQKQSILHVIDSDNGSTLCEMTPNTIRDWDHTPFLMPGVNDFGAVYCAECFLAAQAWIDNGGPDVD